MKSAADFDTPSLRMASHAVKIALACCLLPSALALPAASTPPAEFQPNTRVGPGGRTFKDYPHFRIYDAPSIAIADNASRSLEAAYACFVEDLGWRAAKTWLAAQIAAARPHHGVWHLP